MNSTVVKCLVGISVFILAGVLGYQLFPANSSSTNQFTPESSAASSARVEPSVRAVRQAEDVQTETETETAVKFEDASPAKPDPLRYLSMQTQDESGDMQACIEFDATFNDAKESAIKPFIRISPKTPISVDARGRRLCLLGLDYGQSYEVEST